jgi:uncharacterized MAPEG superfamily protein
MNEVTCLELSIVLWFVHIFTQGAFGGPAVGMPHMTGPRDESVVPKGLMFPRATRALANYVENLGPFVAADLGLIVTQHTGGIGATIWVLARVVYIPLYLAGVSYLRTLCWLVSIVGLALMLVRLAGWVNL